jgi:drug/metabolite transporter (DMT)-like permease
MSSGTRLALISACVLWSMSFIATKLALEVLPPLAVASLRLGVAAACFLPLLLTGGRMRRMSSPGSLLGLLGLSLFGTGLHYGFQTVGMQYTTASNASLYVATGPITILLLGAILLGERLTARKVLGVSIAVVGVLVVMGLDTIASFRLPQRIVGDLLVIASIVMWGCFTVFGKRLTDRLGAVSVTAAVTVIGAAWMAPVGWFEIHHAGFSFAAMTPAAWGSIAFLGAGCNFLAVMLYFIGLQHTESQKVGVYLYTIPPMTAGAAAVVLGEAITVNLVIGTVLVIAGVALTERG